MNTLIEQIFPALEQHPIPATQDELMADRLRHWQSFASVVAIAAAVVIALLAAMAIFLV